MFGIGLIEGVSLSTKTYVTLGLVVLAIIEFMTAMYVVGRKGQKDYTKQSMLLHRIGGYVFLLYWLWPMAVGANLLARLSRYEVGWTFDGPRFYHAFLAVIIFVLLLLKVSFVRFYTQYRQSARLLGILIAVGTVVTWLIAGWFWLCMMGGRTV